MADSTDKRSVSTDALETLGTIIGPNEKRDAIHLAVEPVEAGEQLWAGDDIIVRFGKAYKASREEGAMGIVDPFLGPRKGKGTVVDRGERFWFVMYPRQVRSLRHVWSHPAFPDEGAPVDGLKIKEASEKWMREFCATGGAPNYERIMRALRGERLYPDQDPSDGDAATCEMEGEYWHFNGTDAHGDIPPEFWAHAAALTGRTFPNRPTHFSCSC